MHALLPSRPFRCLLAAVLGLLMAPLAASAAPSAPTEMYVYHCQTPDGRTSMQQSACASGRQKVTRVTTHRRSTRGEARPCLVGKRGGRYTLTPSGRQPYHGCR